MLKTHIQSGVHSTAYVWKVCAYEPRRRVHQPNVLETALRRTAGPQLREPRTMLLPLMAGWGRAGEAERSNT